MVFLGCLSLEGGISQRERTCFHLKCLAALLVLKAEHRDQPRGAIRQMQLCERVLAHVVAGPEQLQ